MCSSDLPRIYFPLAAPHCLPFFAETDADVLSIDWRIDIDAAYSALGEGSIVQGNLDPSVLYADHTTISAEVSKTLDKVASRPHIFNLGHGLQPDMPCDNVAFLVSEVHRQSSK